MTLAAGFDELHSELAACRRCLEEGYWIAPGPVFSRGAGAGLMLIGQAPGPTEAVHAHVCRRSRCLA